MQTPLAIMNTLGSHLWKPHTRLVSVWWVFHELLGGQMGFRNLPRSNMSRYVIWSHMNSFRTNYMIFNKLKILKARYLGFQISRKMSSSVGEPLFRRLFPSKNAAETYRRNILRPNCQKVVLRKYWNFTDLLAPLRHSLQYLGPTETLATKFSNFWTYWDLCDKDFRI